jgi:MFS family permease
VLDLPVPGAARQYARKQNLAFFFLGVFLVYVVFFTSLTMIPLYILELGGSEFHSGLQSTLLFLAAVFLRLYLGPMADSRGRKIPLLIGAFAFCTSSLLYVMANSIWVVMFIRIYEAIGLAAFLSSASSFVADTAPEGKLGRYMSFHRFIITLALLAGPSGALFIINIYSFATWFTINFGLGFFALIMLGLVKTSPLGVTKFSSRERLFHVLKNSNLWPIFLGIILLAFSYGILLTFVSIYIMQVTDIKNPGIYFTYYSIAGLLANFSAGYLSDRFGRLVVSLPFVMLMGLGLAILFLLPVQPKILIISSIMTGFGYFGGSLSLIAWLIEISDLEVRGTVLSIQESGMDLAVAASSFVVGITSSWLGLSISFFIVGLSMLLFVPLFAYRKRNLLRSLDGS